MLSMFNGTRDLGGRFSPIAQGPLVGQVLLIIEASRSHSDTPHSVGLSGRVSSPSQNLLLDNMQISVPQRDSNPQKQQANGCNPTRSQWDRHFLIDTEESYENP